MSVVNPSFTGVDTPVNAKKTTTRITIDLTAELDERLLNLSRAIGATKADTIRDALRILEYLVDRHEDGYELVERKDDVATPMKIFLGLAEARAKKA